MGIQTIEQKMSVASLWDGLAPAGALQRAILHNAADAVVAATKTWTFVNGAFTAEDVGRLILMGGTASGNDGLYTIAAVNLATEIETTEAPVADETAGASPWTQDIYDAEGVATLANDMEAYAESVKGGLFDFGNSEPWLIQQVVIKPGTGTTSWKLELIDVDSEAVEVAAAASADPYFASIWNGKDVSGLILLEGQRLKLTSVGAPTTTSRARISAGRHPG